MSLEYLEIKIISANLESFEDTAPTSYIELEWLPGDNIKTWVCSISMKPSLCTQVMKLSKPMSELKPPDQSGEMMETASQLLLIQTPWSSVSSESLIFMIARRDTVLH